MLLKVKETDWKRGNYKQVQKLLGHSLPDLRDENEAFCCYGSQINSTIPVLAVDKWRKELTRMTKAIDIWEIKQVNKKINVARRLLKGGSDVDFVSKLTGLKVEQVRLLEY